MFDRPIGQNQAIQHPLAKCWMELEAANLMVFKAASLYDSGEPCGGRGQRRRSISPARPRSAPARPRVMTHGGMGYAKEFHVERYLREVLIARIAPVTPQLILSFIAEKALGPAEVVLRTKEAR